MYILHLFPIYIYIYIYIYNWITKKSPTHSKNLLNFNIHLYLAIRGPWPPWRPSRSHCSRGRTSGHGAAMWSTWATAPPNWRWRWWPAPAPGRSCDRRPRLDRTQETTPNRPGNVYNSLRTEAMAHWNRWFTQSSGVHGLAQSCTTITRICLNP